MGLAKNVKKTVKEFRKNPTKVFYRLLNELLDRHSVYGVTKKELIEFLERKLKEMER